MNRAQLTEVFLATLDELAEAPYYVGGKPGKPRLDCDTVLTILLEEVHHWGAVPYAAIRAMFAGLLAHLETHDAERLLACVSGELECAERCADEAKAEKREADALAAARKAVDGLADDPKTLQLFLGIVPLLGKRALDEQKQAVQP